MMRTLRSLLLVWVACLAFASHAAFLDPEFERLESQLRLKPPQKEQFDLAVGATKRVLLGSAMSAMLAKDRLAEELAKDNPDFKRLYSLTQDLVDQNKPLMREAREEWSKLYVLLDADQLVIARRFVEQQLNLLTR